MDSEIRIELLKLRDGQRLLRLEHASSGLCLEKRIDNAAPLLGQKKHWQRIFEALIERELVAA